MTIKNLFKLSVVAISLLSSTQLLAETDCSKEAIGFYLEKGFTTEQISRMCQYSAAETSGTTTNQVQPATVDRQVQETGQAASDNEELIFFNRTIISDSLSVSPEVLSYVRDECIRYGEEDDFTNFRPKVCGVIKTTIQRVGLKVLRAVKGIPIIRDAELLVQGEIQREVLNLDSLAQKDRNTFEKVMQKNPETFDIQTRNDADPEEVARRLVK